MRSWLTYIFLLMVACGTVLTSCSDVLSEEGLGTCDDRTTVRLTISFGGDDDPMSRDVGSNPAPKDDDLDETTEAQAKIVDGDIFALVVNEDNTLVEYIDDLHIVGTVAQDQNNYYTWTLEGTMRPTTGNNKVKIVLLANLKENGIDDPDAYFKRLQVGTNLEEVVYKSLIYSYNGNTWSLSDNRIPMWGETAATTVPASSNANLPCYLYRAMAKVQIWVNQLAEKKGIEGFVINKIEVKNIHKKGYCVSTESYDENSLNYANGAKPYAAPSVPNEPGTQTVTYGSDEHPLNVTDTYSDKIYIPERFNTDNDAVTIDVHYTFNGEAHTGTIEFKKDGKGNRFDVIRNHSYIFNINIVEEQTGKLYYYVDWEEEEVNIEFN